MKAIVVGDDKRISQFRKPRGWLGRFVLWKMNSRHSKLTDWGLSHVSIQENYTILDVGCGGGRTLSKLAAMAKQGKVYGVDYSEESVAASGRTNVHWIKVGRVEVEHGSVSQLPFPDGMFDLVTAVETHFWWPDLPRGMREILRVLKPGAKLTVIAEVYRGANTKMARLCEQYATKTGMTILDVGEHRDLFTQASYSGVEIFLDESKGWICVAGKKG